jgi:sulfhydrogenase subunit beta (sulfur reductase)
MSDARLLPAQKLDDFIAAVNGSSTLVAPAAIGEGGTPGETLFRPVSSAADMAFDRVNTRLSVKGLFFPQRETLLGFEGSVLREVPAPGGRQVVIFGARPCDAQSLLFMDKVFEGKATAPGNVTHEDPYYVARRRASIVISLACDSPCPSCFCTSVGGHPYGTDGADILASRASADGADSFLLEPVTDRGRAFLAEHAGLLAPADPGAEAAREARARAAAAGMKVLDFSGVKEKADSSFDSPVWERIARICLGCGVCTYVCPTCHCFDITDETVGTAGIRVRTWDACQYPLYTMHASGHNPRPAKRARMRQRIMHKYSYTVETAGTVSCTGCGRCVRQCPVNLDIRQMLLAVKNETGAAQ